MDKQYFKRRISCLESDIQRWKEGEKREKDDYTRGLYRGMIMAIEPIIEEYQRILDRG